MFICLFLIFENISNYSFFWKVIIIKFLFLIFSK